MISLNIRVPHIGGTLTQIYAEHLRFGMGNGDGIAKFYEDTAGPWKGDQHVALHQQTTNANGFDTVHSIYGAAMSMQTFSMSFITAHGLFCLAAYLKARPSAELASFTGIVYGFGSSKMFNKSGMNQTHGSPWAAQDLMVPVLYLINGRPVSIYTMWHTDQPEDNALFAFSGDDISVALDCIAQEPAVT
jgi:hypothetical protein